jgi:hypothetical protein
MGCGVVGAAPSGELAAAAVGAPTGEPAAGAAPPPKNSSSFGMESNPYKDEETKEVNR